MSGALLCLSVKFQLQKQKREFFQQKQQSVCVHSQWFSPNSAAGGGAGSLKETKTCLNVAPPWWNSKSRSTRTHKHHMSVRLHSLSEKKLTWCARCAASCCLSTCSERLILYGSCLSWRNRQKENRQGEFYLYSLFSTEKASRQPEIHFICRTPAQLTFINVTQQKQFSVIQLGHFHNLSPHKQIANYSFSIFHMAPRLSKTKQKIKNDGKSMAESQLYCNNSSLLVNWFCCNTPENS